MGSPGLAHGAGAWRARVFRHLAVEDLGILERLLTARGAQIETVDVPRAAQIELAAHDAELLIVLGGPIGAGDDTEFPFLTTEREAICRRVEAGQPTLGICLGAQLIAHALGARIGPAPSKEIGWGTVTLTDAGRASCLAALESDEPTVLHWHGDNAELPAGAERLASTPACPNQAFRIDRHVLGLQFHLEPRPEDIEAWLVAHIHEIGATSGVSVANIRADTALYGATATKAGQAAFANWLAQLELSAP